MPNLSLHDALPICDFFVENGDKAFRGNQVYEWLWHKAAHSFDDMTSLSKATRKMLDENFVINHIEVDTMQRSNDGTIKNAIKLHDGLIVESVLIPTEKRTTACVSSQVGCSLDCKFCATARLKRMRNLNADEIYDQVVAIDKQSRLYHNHKLSNIVFIIVCIFSSSSNVNNFIFDSLSTLFSFIPFKLFKIILLL